MLITLIILGYLSAYSKTSMFYSLLSYTHTSEYTTHFFYTHILLLIDNQNYKRLKHTRIHKWYLNIFYNKRAPYKKIIRIVHHSFLKYLQSIIPYMHTYNTHNDKYKLIVYARTIILRWTLQGKSYLCSIYRLYKFQIIFIKKSIPEYLLDNG